MSRKTYCLAAIFIAVGAPFVLANVALAAPAGVSNVENFYTKRHPSGGGLLL